MMKLLLLYSAIAMAFILAIVFADQIKSAIKSVGAHAEEQLFFGMVKMGLIKPMVLLGRSYANYPAATIVQLQTSTEAALVAQNLASVSAGPVTPGNVSTSETTGRAGIAAAGTQVVITNPLFDANSKFVAYLSNAAADGTALSITRIVPAAGQVTFVLNAAATAAVAIDWMLLMKSGELPNQ